MKMKTKFKKPLFPVDYAGHIEIQDGEFYEDNNVLDYGNILNENNPITEEMAKDYAKLFCVAPYLFEALKHICNISESKGVEGCTWGDTNLDSVAASEGYNQCREYMQGIAIKAIQMLDADFSF